MEQSSIEEIAEEITALVGSGRQVQSISERYDGFDLKAAYDVVARVQELRAKRGENPIGRKMGFTNRNIWETYKISAPVWNFIFDKTVHDLIPGGGGALWTGSSRSSAFPEPLIEPELVLHLSHPPVPGMSQTELVRCIDWVAPGFEIVYSIFPSWKFSAADAAAAYGMHGELFVGGRHALPADSAQAVQLLSAFSVTLTGNDGQQQEGRATDILDGPLQVLAHLADEIARYNGSAPLLAGEIVTTGTLTKAMPALPGQSWTAQFSGLELDRIELRLE